MGTRICAKPSPSSASIPPSAARSSLDDNRQAVTSTFIVEAVEASDGSLTQETVHTVSEVGQTLGLPRDRFLALGPPSRANTRCLEHPVLEAETTSTAPETEIAAVTPDDQPSPDADVDVETSDDPADTFRDLLLSSLKTEPAMTETGPAICSMPQLPRRTRCDRLAQGGVRLHRKHDRAGTGWHDCPRAARLRLRPDHGGLGEERRARNANSLRPRRNHAVDLHCGGRR